MNHSRGPFRDARWEVEAEISERWDVRIDTSSSGSKLNAYQNLVVTAGESNVICNLIRTVSMSVPLTSDVTRVGSRPQPYIVIQLLFSSTRTTWNQRISVTIVTYQHSFQNSKSSAMTPQPRPRHMPLWMKNQEKLSFYPASLHVSKGGCLIPSIDKSPHVIQGTHREIDRALLLKHLSPS